MGMPYQIGTKLTLPDRVIAQEYINRYAKASGDMNPLHIDPDFARKTRFGGTIAHGLMSVAFISALMTKSFGHAWASSGELDVSFLAPVRSGDTIETAAEIVSLDDTSGRIELKVYCKNQEGKSVIAGTASIRATGGTSE